MKTKLSEIIVTLFFIGKSKYAPGTLGSLCAFPVLYTIIQVAHNKIMSHLSSWLLSPPDQHITSQIIFLITTTLLASLLLFILGVYCISIYIKNMSNQDPQEVIIDEIVGQMLTIVCCFPAIFMIRSIEYFADFNLCDIDSIDTILLFILPFILFRIFDICKPWPINWLDQNCKGGFGVMIDDIAAAMFATILHYPIVSLISYAIQ